MKIILTLLIVLTIALSGKDIDFDALAKSEPQSGSVSLSFKDAAKVNEKNIMKLQRKQIKPIYDGLKAISDYSRNERSQTYSSSSSSGSKTFSCTYSCLSDVGLLYETYRNVGSMKISSNSYSSAIDKAYSIAEKRCKATLDKHGYKMRGGSVDCDFGR